MVEVDVQFLLGVAVTVFIALIFFGVIVLWDVALAVRSLGDKIDKLDDNLDDDLKDIGYALDRLSDVPRNGGGTQLHLSSGTISSTPPTNGHSDAPAQSEATGEPSQAGDPMDGIDQPRSGTTNIDQHMPNRSDSSPHVGAVSRQVDDFGQEANNTAYTDRSFIEQFESDDSNRHEVDQEERDPRPSETVTDPPSADAAKATASTEANFHRFPASSADGESWYNVSFDRGMHDPVEANEHDETMVSDDSETPESDDDISETAVDASDDDVSMRSNEDHGTDIEADDDPPSADGDEPISTSDDSEGSVDGDDANSTPIDGDDLDTEPDEPVENDQFEQGGTNETDIDADPTDMLESGEGIDPEFEPFDVEEFTETTESDPISIDDASERLSSDPPTMSMSDHGLEISTEVIDDGTQIVFSFDTEELQLSGSVDRLLRYQLQNFINNESHDGFVDFDDDQLTIEVSDPDGATILRWAEAVSGIVDRTVYLSENGST